MKISTNLYWRMVGLLGLSFLISTPAVGNNRVVVIPLNSSSKSDEIPTVISAGQVWMDRNLGALRVATKSDDPDSYGTLYQWGRGGDGHEYRSSPVTATNSTTDTPGHGSFIVESIQPLDWRFPQSSELWGDSDINNPCPAGFRIPTRSEWQIERESWTNKDATGALSSPLKLPMAGYRSNTTAVITKAGTFGFYWTSRTWGTYAESFYFSNGYAGQIDDPRAIGGSIRCIKD